MLRARGGDAGHISAGPACDRMLKQAHEAAEDQREHEIDNDGETEDRAAVTQGVADQGGAERQVLDRHQRHQRRELQHGDELVAEWRHHQRQRLRQDDAKQAIPHRQPERYRGLALALGYGVETGANDL
jgi:hypothetical protein